MNRIPWLAALLAATLALGAPIASADSLDHQLRLLPDEPGWFMSLAASVSENNVIVGSYSTDGLDLLPVSWGPAGYLDVLSAFGGPFVYQGGQALGINESGVIAGSAYEGPNWWEPAHAMLWNQAGTPWKDLHPAGWEHSIATDVNNGGTVLGQVMDADFYSWAYVWEADGTERFLSPLGTDPYSDSRRLNDAGYAVGRSLSAAWNDRAVVWAPDGTPIDVHALLPAGTTRSGAMDISEDNVVAGFAVDASGEFFAWTWKVGAAAPTILDDDPIGDGGASGIGGAYAAGNVGFPDWITWTPDTVFATLWLGGSKRVFAHLPGFGNSYFEDVNSRGVAVGYAVNEGGIGIFGDGGRALVAVPTPEPGTLLLVGLAAVGIVVIRRRYQADGRNPPASSRAAQRRAARS